MKNMLLMQLHNRIIVMLQFLSSGAALGKGRMDSRTLKKNWTETTLLFYMLKPVFVYEMELYLQSDLAKLCFSRFKNAFIVFFKVYI